ncbi:MAG TPA: HAD-IIIC family phosphatase [Mycobacteriales bacterium]|nr:HAD-IIIC family phosphatase [Mycobacteriales bacterium]
MSRPPVKVVVWDLDGTLWPGIALESDELPSPYPAAVTTLDTLAGRGILVSVASRNPSEIGVLVEKSMLAGRFVAPQYGWGRKADALRRIADELDVGLDTLAFVDDDPFERADVERTLPSVTVLAPDEVAAALDWPELGAGPVTAAALSRLDSYRQRERRREARTAFAGSDEDFLGWCGLRATVRLAAADDRDRLVELAQRTTQYNSTGIELPAGPTVVLELADRFGDDGLVGAGVLSTSDGPVWTAGLVAVSCRAGGRGGVPLLLTGLGRLARSRGGARLLVPCRLTERNVPVRLGLKQAGFTASSRASDDAAVYGRDLAAAPEYPGWVDVEERL